MLLTIFSYLYSIQTCCIPRRVTYNDFSQCRLESLWEGWWKEASSHIESDDILFPCFWPKAHFSAIYYRWITPLHYSGKKTRTPWHEKFTSYSDRSPKPRMISESPPSVIDKAETQKYLPQAVPNSTLSEESKASTVSIRDAQVVHKEKYVLPV